MVVAAVFPAAFAEVVAAVQPERLWRSGLILHIWTRPKLSPSVLAVLLAQDQPCKAPMAGPGELEATPPWRRRESRSQQLAELAELAAQARLVALEGLPGRRRQQSSGLPGPMLRLARLAAADLLTDQLQYQQTTGSRHPVAVVVA